MNLYNIYTEAELVKSEKDQLPDSSFGLPKTRQYPLHDAEHVRKAIQMFSHCPEKNRKELANNIFLAAKKFSVEISEKALVYKYLTTKQQKELSEQNEHSKKISETNPMMMFVEFYQFPLTEDNIEKYRNDYTSLNTLSDLPYKKGLLLIDKNDQVGGFIQVDTRTNTLRKLEVNPIYRKQGIGSKLLNTEVGKLASTVILPKEDAKLLSFFKQNGFIGSNGLLKRDNGKLSEDTVNDSVTSEYLQSAMERLVTNKDIVNEMSNYLDYLREASVAGIASVAPLAGSTIRQPFSVTNSIRKVTINCPNMFDYDEFFEAEESKFVCSEGIEYNNEKLYPFYIVCVGGETFAARNIRRFTNSLFSHAALSLDLSMKKLYAFNARINQTGNRGFRFESLEGYKKDYNLDNYPLLINCVFIKEKDYINLKQRLDYYVNNQANTKYDFMNLFRILFNKAIEINDDLKFVCSEFVASVFSYLNINLIDKKISLTTPNDLAYCYKINKFVYNIFNGSYTDFNTNKLKGKLSGIKLNAKAILENSNLLEDFYYNDLDVTEPVDVAKNTVDGDNASSSTIKKPQDMIKAEDDLLQERYILNNDDIYYNKNKFDKGEINLCFITGHSGSGKSTMGRNMSNKNIEHYDMDDLLCVKDHFTMENLKEYGDLIYSFFNGIGKHFYIGKEDLKNIPQEKYEDVIFKLFINYAKKYAQVHKDKKYVVDGVWIFHYNQPQEFKDYAFYIKGTSMLISKLRGAKRDASDAKNKVKRLAAFSKNFFIIRWKYFILDERKIKIFYEYFSKLINEKAKLKEDIDFTAKADAKVVDYKDQSSDVIVGIDRYTCHKDKYGCYYIALNANEHEDKSRKLQILPYLNEDMYISSDFHINHKNRNSANFTNLLVSEINSKVPIGGTFLFCGDLGSKSLLQKDVISSFISKLNVSRKILVLGNHDNLSLQDYYDMGFTFVTDIIETEKYIFSHCPVSPKDKINVHGHIHGEKEYWNMPAERHINVYIGSHDNKIYQLKDYLKFYKQGKYKGKSVRKTFDK